MTDNISFIETDQIDDKVQIILRQTDYTEDVAKDWRQGFIMASWHNGRLLMPEMIMVCGEDEVEFRGEILKV